ncbi:MAG: carbon monoxide dehydrogenase [Dehalococcoidia bacterium]|nr:MAG: carbon monoxide dehydrogenase [Dehalococcoidia bacterium]
MSVSNIAAEIPVLPTSPFLTWKNRWDHIQARWRWKRGEHKVIPGLYAIGNPTPDSPVFISANYTLSFDALRTSLTGIDAYILVLNTFGINVWCAAGKHTFGTEELVERIDTSELARVVRHRTVILPQLGAPGVAAHKVKKQSGFKVEYGPVRARDLPEYLKTHKATPEMRLVRFGILDRLILAPVELLGYFLYLVIAAVALYFWGGWTGSLLAVLAIAGGAVLFPLLLPWLPTKDFSTKGWSLGLVVTLAVVLMNTLWLKADISTTHRVMNVASNMLIWPTVVAFIALNFTGSSTFTSRSGVKAEMRSYIRPMAVSFILGIILNIIARFL